MFAFFIRCLECHLPLVNDIVTVSFLAIIPENFARISGHQVERFGVFVNIMMKPPFKAAWTFPKFNGVIAVWVEEAPQLAENRCSMRLERMRFAVEYFLCSMNGVCYNDDLGDVFFGAGLVNTASNGKQFCLHACYKCCMMHCFGERMVCYVNMQYRCSNVILDASICYYEGCVIWRRVLKNHIIKFLSTNFIFFFFFFIN